MVDEATSLRKSLQMYKGLVEVSGLVNSITDYGELLREILDVARRVMKAEAASLFFVNEKTGFLDLAIATEREGYEYPDISIPPGTGIAGWVFQHGESVLVPDAYEDDRFYRSADNQTGFRTRSILCSPLKYNGAVIGVLQVLNSVGRPSFDTEDMEGFTAYATLTATAIEKLRAIDRMRSQERMERDISIAAEIQGELLSSAIPASIEGASFASHNAPAANVGGDFYGVFAFIPEEIHFVIGDVSGKGMAAAMLMAQTLVAMEFVFASAGGPAAALARLNETLYQRIVRGMFITTIVGRMTPATRRVELASAGHCRPILLRADGVAEEIQTSGSLPLGVLQKTVYRQEEVILGVGDRLVFFTDGLTESRSAVDGEFFEERIFETLNGRQFDSADSLLLHVVEAEKSHRLDNPQLDDLTILVGGFE